MSRPIKSHLPLITTRIEFKFNLLPPPPQLTTRRDFGAHVRRHMRRNPSPYDRPKARTKPPAITRSITVDFQSDSALSDISDAEEDEDSPSSSKLIPKPGGEAGKVNSGGYNLENALGWTKKRYEEFSVSFLYIDEDEAHLFVGSHQGRSCEQARLQEMFH